jgi:hypothetical protein
VTEKHYFLSTRHLLRSLIELEVIPGGDPKKLVEIAVEKKGSSERNDGSFAYDQVWCVYDVDDHKRLPDARQQARAHGIHLAISNPCFELWALLHFQNQNSYVERDKLRARLQRHLPEYDKKLPCDQLLPLLEEAIRRCRHLDDRHQKNGTEGANPSTGVYLLMEEVRSQADTMSTC